MNPETATIVNEEFAYDFTGNKHDYYIKVNDEWKKGTGVTTILSETLPKPLTWWAAGMALENLGWRNKKQASKEELWKYAGEAREYISELSNEDYADLLQECYARHNTFKNERAKEGTDTHKELELWLQSCIDQKTLLKPVLSELEPIYNWAVENEVTFLATEIPLYDKDLFVCGTADILFEIDGKKYIGDLKTGKGIYLSYKIQLSAYSKMIKEDIYGFTILRLNKDFEEYTLRGEALKELGQVFENLVYQYRIQKKYGDN